MVEDTPVNQRVALAMLAKLGYRADAVGDGREALTALERVPYDAILMDVQMPEMDGLAATAAIRAREGAGTHTPVIAMTANAMPGERERCLMSGMDDYISKPFQMQQLGRVVARWLPVADDTAALPAGPPAPRASVGAGAQAVVEPAAGRDGAASTLNGDAPAPPDIIPAWQLPDRVLDPAALAGFGPELIADVAALFLRDAPQHLAALRALVPSGDLAGVRREAHALKGIAGTLGAREVVDQAAQLERLAQTPNATAAADLLADLERAFERATAALEAVRA